MKNNAYFQFQYLHPTGGGTKCLAIPAQSSSFKWTAQQVACLAGQAGTIYILAQEDLDLSEDDSSNDELGGDIHDAPIPVMSSRRQSLPLNNDESSDDDDQFPVGPVQLSGRKSTTEVEMVDESMVPGPSNTNLPAQSGVSQDIIQKTDEKNTDGLYNNYVNLLSSDEELIFSPISPVYSLLTPPETTFIDYHSVEVLLKKHGSEVLSDDKDDVFRLKVRRRHIMEDSLQYFKRGIPVSKHLRVTFLGEPAVDAGGPLREFFRLLLREISNNNMLFCGEETARVPIHNILELSKQTFRYVGQIIGSSLLNGGPSPGFFADFIADYIVFGIEKVQVRVQDVVDPKMKSKLTELLNAPDEDSFITLLDSDDYDFRYDCGVRQPTTMMTINDRDDIVSALAMQTVFSIKAEMDQMIAGLNDYGLGELARNNSEVLRQLFVHYRQLPLTSDTLYDMFAPQLSSSGSNIRNEEEAALMHWVYYTRDVQDGKQILEVTDSQTLMKNTFQVSLKLIMIFATGMAEEPPMGFDPKPSLRFHNDIPYARANTCSNEISIPRQFKDYEDFAYNVTYGIANSMGFGVP
ncbi:G2/M phase-specific E3 ubiquitin-protein ligase-like [Dysidea avara]|uniref:G2/M phase-specific E3 ubiquitin-protein ligase-like n=1 Tax=Dysidea avara TaxID=196820 RepID=UPI00332907D5